MNNYIGSVMIIVFAIISLVNALFSRTLTMEDRMFCMLSALIFSTLAYLEYKDCKKL